jgi:hypothetical protein
MKQSTIFLLSFMLSFTILNNKVSANARSESNIVQLAILLDTSNSMDGLIDQAKSQLWKIVNEMSRSKKGGRNYQSLCCTL